MNMAHFVPWTYINERRQIEGSPNEHGAFRPMDVYQSRRGRNERGRSTDRDRGRGSDNSSSRGEGNTRRSKSRDRGSLQRGKRSRSTSPQSEYHKVLDRWKKFKQSQRVMLDGVQRKREIYDKRPEDHPDYPEEWRLFWEKRYKELQAQGKDADNHDYKTEWIPFWGKRVHEIYEAEIKVKTESMLHKYELSSANEPKRDDFPDQPLAADKKISSNKDVRDEISNFVGDYQRYRSARGNDDLMVVGEYSGSSNNYNRSNNERRDQEKDYKENDRDRQHRSNRDRERERGRHRNSEDRGMQRTGRDRRSNSKERFGPWHNKDSERHHGSSRAESPYLDKNCDTGGKKKYNSDRHSPCNQDAMSGLTVLENLRDRGVSRSPIRDSRSGNEKSGQGSNTLNYMAREIQDTSPRLMETLRILTALEDLLGSLGPQINIILSRAITLENNKEGSGNVLLEDQDIAAILQMTKEKLSGQIIAGLLEPQKEFAVRNCIDKLAMILQIATKNRPSNPPALKNTSSHNEIIERKKNKFKKILAEQMATLLIKRGLQNIDDWYLHYLVYEVAKSTPLDDGSLIAPPQRNYSHRKEECIKTAGPSGGYSTGLSSEKSSSIFEEKSDSVARKMDPLKDRISSNGRRGEFDDLSIHELKSLLDNFDNLSQMEQKDLIEYMKKQEIVNPDKVTDLKSSCPSLFKPASNANEKIPTDGLGTAMLQVLARNVQRFTNENVQNLGEGTNRSEFQYNTTTNMSNVTNTFQSTIGQINSTNAPIDSKDSSANALNLALQRSETNQTTRNSSSLSNALGAPPPPPPPPENSISCNFAQQSQQFGGTTSYPNQRTSNTAMADVNDATSNQFEHRGNMHINAVPNNSGYSNYGAMSTTLPNFSTRYPTQRGYNPGTRFNSGIRANTGNTGNQDPSHYGNNQRFPNQFHRPRFW